MRWVLASSGSADTEARRPSEPLNVRSQKMLLGIRGSWRSLSRRAGSFVAVSSYSGAEAGVGVSVGAQTGVLALSSKAAPVSRSMINLPDIASAPIFHLGDL